MANSIAGAWELVDDDNEGMIVLTDTDFCVMVVKKDRRAWPAPVDPAQMTDEMRLEAWGGLGPIFAGTYEIVASEGDTYEVVMRPRLARVPLATMAEIREKAVLEGERLKVTTPRGRTETWRRIS